MPDENTKPSVRTRIAQFLDGVGWLLKVSQKNRNLLEGTMAAEQNASPRAWMRVAWRALNTLMQPLICLSLLALAMIGAVLSLFFGSYLVALTSLTTGVVAAGLALVHAAISIQAIGTLQLGIRQGISDLRDEELKKIANPVEAAEPQEPPPVN